MGAISNEMFYVKAGGVPWHGLGEAVDEAPYARLAQVKAKLEWTADKFELWCKDGTYVPGAWAVRRSSDNNVLGVVGDKYTVIQPKEMFELVEACLDVGARFETGGQLFGGRLIWALAKTEEFVDVVTGDEIAPFLLVTNTFDGSSNLQACLTAVRAVCENTITAAIAEGKRHVKIRHTAGWFNKIAEARRVLGCARDIFAGLQTDLGKLSTVNLDFSKVERWTEKLIPLPKDTSTGRADKILLARSTLENKINRPIGLEHGRGTLYQAWAGVTEFVSHSWESRRKVGDERAQAERRMTDLAFGSGQRTTFAEQAWNSLSELAV